MEILKDRRFENLSDMKHEPRKFGWRKLLLFLIYAKLLPYTISDGESQTPLLRFLLRGGGGRVCTQDRSLQNAHGMLADHL